MKPDRLNWVLESLVLSSGAQRALLDKAWAFAVEKHGEQVRKYTNEPYVAHCDEVAAITACALSGASLASYHLQFQRFDLEADTADVIAAALLHDVVEDTDATGADICAQFGFRIGSLVMQVTDVSRPGDGNRKARKDLDREHLAHACAEAQTIKLADLISNSRSIAEHDEDFARVYMREKSELLKILTLGSHALWCKADAIVNNYLFPTDVR